VKYSLYFAHRLGYLQDAEYNDLKNAYERLGKSLWSDLLLRQCLNLKLHYTTGSELIYVNH